MTTTLAGHTYRFVPATTPGEKRTLLLLHGTGGDENDLIALGEMLAPGANYLSPRGNVSENGANRFFRRLAEGVFDIEDLHKRTAELATFVREAIALHDIDPDRITAVGFSNGANVAASMLLAQPGVVSSAVLIRAMVPFEPETHGSLHGTRVLLLAGTVDQMIPAENTGKLASLLEERGADVTLETVNAGHGLTQADVRIAWDWLEQARPLDDRGSI